MSEVPITSPTTDVPNGGGTIQATGMLLTGVTGADGIIPMP